MDSATSGFAIPKSIASRLNGSSPFEILVSILIGCFMVWFAKFHWNRRKLYRLAGKIPGPSAYPLVGSTMQLIINPSDIFSKMDKIFDEYPKICKFWFGPRCIYGISDPKYLEKLLINCLEKAYIYDEFKFAIGDGLFSAPYKTWKIHRKIVSPTFNRRILDNFVPVFNEQSNIFIEQLRNYKGKEEFDILDVISNCTLDIICETTMGITVNAQTTKSSFPSHVHRSMEILFLKISLWWYHIYPIFNISPLYKELMMCIRTALDFTGKVINDKIREFENQKQLDNSSEFDNNRPRRKVLLDYLLEIIKRDNLSYTRQQLQDELTTFIVGGMDTTAGTIGFVFTMLGLHQDLQEKVYNEVLDIIGPDRDVEPEDLSKLIFLERFIKETLRLFPAAPVIVRAVHKDIDIGDNIIIPTGITAVVYIFKIHRSELYWKDPLKFDPDRFLPEEIAERHPCCYIPFSYGPRNCIGLKFAMMSLKTLMANVIRKYRIYTAYTKVEDVKIKCSLMLRPADGFKVNIELR